MNKLTDVLEKSALWQRVFRCRAEDTLPHTIRHQRIYIVPSKRGLAFLFTLLIMLVASINYALSLGYALCFLLTGLFSATLLHTYRNVAGIAVSSIIGQNTFAGTHARFKLSLSASDGRSRYGIGVSTRQTEGSALLVQGTGQTEASIEIPTVKRGVCKLGRVTVQSDWPLGLWTCWSYLHVDKQTLVYPAPEQKAPPLPQVAGHHKTGQTHAGQQGDVSGLRDYQAGDSIGSIAWKSLARGAGLKSRTFDSEESAARTLLTLQQTRLPDLEARLSRLCAWVLQAERTQTHYAFEIHGTRLSESRGDLHKAKALEAMARYTSKAL